MKRYTQRQNSSSDRLGKFNNIIYVSRFAMCLIHKSGLIAWIGERNNQLFGHLRCFIDKSWSAQDFQRSFKLYAS
jgi:hypothetical protein